MARNRSVVKENLTIKEKLAANTYSTFTCYRYQNNQFKPCGPIPERWMFKQVAREMVAAKKQGLAINFSVSWSPGVPIRLKTLEKLKEFLGQYQKLLIKNAEFAEKYQVEYFNLGEPDHLISEQNLPISDKERAEIINQFKDEVLPEIRKVYRGKVYYQIGDAGYWGFSLLDPSGLDFFGVLVGGSCDFSRFKNLVDQIFARSEELSQKYALPWIISELWINKNYQGPDFCNLEGERDQYFQYVFQKTGSVPHLNGIIIDSWNVDEPGFETSVKDTPEESIIKNFFEGWN